MQTQPIRIGIIGAGANTRKRHLPGLNSIPGVSVVAVCNRARASSEAVAREFGIPRVAADWREIVTAPDIDAIVVGTWPYVHAEISIAALAQGKHVLTEARMANTLAEAEEMLAASLAQPKLIAQIVPAPITLDLDGTIRGLLDAGALGEVREICLTHTTAGYADASAPISWRQQVQLNGINTLSLGIYLETLLRWIPGQPQSVQADAGVFTRHRPDAHGRQTPVTIPDSLSVLARYPGGTRLIAHFSGLENGGGRNEFRLNGSQGTLRIDVGRQEIWHSRAAAPETLIPVPAAARRGWRVEQDFIDGIRLGTPPTLTDFKSGVEYMRFTDACVRAAAATGRR